MYHSSEILDLFGPSNISSSKMAQKAGSSAWGMPSDSSAFQLSTDASLFSSSLPVLTHGKLRFAESGHGIRSMDDASSEINQLCDNVEKIDSLDGLNLHEIGGLLPDDEDELLAGIMDEFDLSGVPSQAEELEEYDLFCSGGGLELDYDPTESLTIGVAKTSISDGYMGNGIGHHGLPNGIGAVVGEHPYGEHPSRTLFVRNINSNVEDTEVQSLFEQYGPIRTLYTACKHRGFVMISYYDIRHARAAMRALQNKPLRRRKLDIHFSIPKNNPSDKDMNQGTLVIFNLDPSVSNDDLLQIFGVFGEVKEIRETPHKRHHKFIEFYDVRAAEDALRTLNRVDIAGKRIKLEPSRPGGSRRNFMQQMTQEIENDEPRSYRHQIASPLTNSPPGMWARFSTPNESSLLQTFSRSPSAGAPSPIGSNHSPGSASVLPLLMSNSVKKAPIGRDQSSVNADQLSSNSNLLHGAAFQHPRSFPEMSGAMLNLSSSPRIMSSFGSTTSSASGAGLTGPQFLWGSSTYLENSHSSAWQSPSLQHSFASNGHVQGQGQGIYYSTRNAPLLAPSHHHHQYHVGSAPSGIPSQRNIGYFPESSEASFMSPLAYGGMGTSQNGRNLMMNMFGQAPINPAVSLSGSENSSRSFDMMSSQRMGPFFPGKAPYPGLVSTGFEGLIEHSFGRQIDNNGNQQDSKKQYQIDLEKIISGEDMRTTLMIKNIPNKYTSKMLLAAIDESHKGTYDFLYLPIDFKNKCNVGYAFINMVSPSHIVTFYKAFNGKKWEKFNSEKVASLAYARIQGKAALLGHFQNSSLMSEDKRCRPILFNSQGLEVGDQDLNGTDVRMHNEDGTISGNSLETSAENQNNKLEKNSITGSSSEVLMH